MRAAAWLFLSPWLSRRRLASGRITSRRRHDDKTSAISPAYFFDGTCRAFARHLFIDACLAQATADVFYLYRS